MSSATKPPSNEPPQKSLAPGDMLGGKFRVERVVGRGGMGVVVEATNMQLDQKVALKLLAKSSSDPAAVERFNGEARAAARLKSEHVARVYDVGKDTNHGPFIVMEMLEGKTLAEVVTTSGRVPIHRAVEYIIDACEGLAEAHSRGIVHQDVKPANLFLVTGADGRPSVKLLDFGIATMRSKEHVANTKSSQPSSLGTPAYLAPEQLRGTPPVDLRADVWSLGCVLYELLVADRPFRATRFTELVTKILESPPHPFPSDLELPPALAAAVVRCLERDPAKRFSSTGALALALLPFARPRAHLAAARAVAHVKASGIDPTLEMPPSMPPESDGRTTDVPDPASFRAPMVPRFSSGPASSSAASATPPSQKRSPFVVPGLAVVLLALAGAAAWALFAARPPHEPTAEKPMASATTPAFTASSPAATLTTAVASASASSAPADSAAPTETSATPSVPAATAARPTQTTQKAAPPVHSSVGTAPSKPESEIRYER